MSYLPPGTFIAVTLVFTGILIFETVRYAIKVKRGEICKQSWLYAMPAFIFCAIFAAVERFFLHTGTGVRCFIKNTTFLASVSVCLIVVRSGMGIETRIY